MEPDISAGTLGWAGGKNHDHQTASADAEDETEEEEVTRTSAAWQPLETRKKSELHL